MEEQKEKIERERNEAKTKHQQMEARLSELNSAQAKLIEEIKKGTKDLAQTEEDLTLVTTEDLEEISKGTSQSIFPISPNDNGTLESTNNDSNKNSLTHPHGKEETSESTNTGAPCIQDENANRFWKTGIWAEIPDSNIRENLET